MCGPGSSVGIATGYGLDGPGIESAVDKTPVIFFTFYNGQSGNCMHSRVGGNWWLISSAYWKSDCEQVSSSVSACGVWWFGEVELTREDVFVLCFHRREKRTFR
jgi:hypothetical protein